MTKYLGISLLNLWLKRAIIVFYGLQQLTACLNSQDRRRVHLRDRLACCWTGTWKVIGRTKKLCIYTGNDIAWFLLRVGQYVGLKKINTEVYSIVFQWVIKPLTVLKDKINLQMHHSQSCWGNYLRGSYIGNLSKRIYKYINQIGHSNKEAFVESVTGTICWAVILRTYHLLIKDHSDLTLWRHNVYQFFNMVTRVLSLPLPVERGRELRTLHIASSLVIFQMVKELKKKSVWNIVFFTLTRTRGLVS